MTGPRTIGLFTASLHTGAAATLVPGVMEEARQKGVNLVCFPGGRLGSDVAWEKQRNFVYGYARQLGIQGLVAWASSMGGMVSPDTIAEFLGTFAPLPLVTISQAVPSCPVIRVDAYGGMSTLVEHLIHDHQCRRFVFIRAPRSHQSGEERWEAFQDTLTRHGLSLDPSHVLGPYPWEAGDEAMVELLDRRHLAPGRDFDALVAASDLLSFRAMQILQQRGWQVPRDVVVGGFNDTAESRLAVPPMTTVAMPFERIGRHGVDTLVRWLDTGVKVPDELLPTRLVRRQSCGCHAESLSLGRVAPVPFQGTADHWVEDFLDAAQRILDLEDITAHAWLLPLAEALAQDYGHTPVPGAPARPSAFLVTLGKVLERAGLNHQGLSVWQEVLSWILGHPHPALLPGNESTLDDLVHKGRAVISEHIQVRADQLHWAAQAHAANLRDLGRDLMECITMSELADLLADRLPLLGIPGAWLVVERRLYLSCWDHHRSSLDPQGLPLDDSTLVPLEELPRGRPWALVAEPLFFHETPYGAVILELGSASLDTYEELRGYLSAAVHRIILFNELARARAEAEKADQIKTRLLANVSHELRSPLNLIISQVRALQEPGTLAKDLGATLDQVEQNALHELRVVNDLLDLSRAEIDELDLAREAVDLAPMLRMVFEEFRTARSQAKEVTWIDAIQPRLPLVWADPARIRQAVINLATNAANHTETGSIELGARADETWVSLWVRDTGSGIPEENLAQLFEPFSSNLSARPSNGGIGLGLSITKRMVILHGGSISVESQRNQGSTFTIRLPIPSLEGRKQPLQRSQEPVLLVLGQEATVAPEIRQLAADQDLRMVFVESPDQVEDMLRSGLRPRTLAWDIQGARNLDWALVRHLRQHPSLFQLPFLSFGGEVLGPTGLVSRGPDQASLGSLIEQCCPHPVAKPVYVVDDDPRERNRTLGVLQDTMPGIAVRTFPDGPEALEAMAREAPGLVILDFVMPRMSGADVLDAMRRDPDLRHVPVIIISNKVFDQGDIRRIENHARVVLQHKNIWTPEETASAIDRIMDEEDSLNPQTSILVKRAVMFLNQHYHQPLSRWQVAEAVHVSEDYLSRVFQKELGLGPWEYLNRYRIWQAGNRLVTTTDSIRNIAMATGFSDQAYFSRVFRKITGMSPQEFRQKG